MPRRQTVRPGCNRVLLLASLHLIALSALETHAQTPSGWLIHDMSRPRPPIVQPVRQALPLAPPADARVLFDGSDLSQWRSADGGQALWVVRDGYMESVPESGYLFTVDGFGDMQLHVEWASPATPQGTGQQRGNSGVFLMGKYEIQVLDSFNSETYADGQAAALYGQYPPLANACLPPGEWQSYDIVFRRPRFDQEGALLKPARVTLLHNGVLVQDASELWGPTSWLQHFSYESHADRLPLSLQDHGNPVRFRNIWLRELAERDLPPALRDATRPYYAVAMEQLERYAGTYQAADDSMFEVLLDSHGSLSLQPFGRRRLELVPSGPHAFFLRWTDGRILFQLDGRELVQGLTMELGGRTYEAHRVDASVGE